MKRPRKKQSKIVGHKAGTKRSDKRWIDEHGNLWASRFEYLVYEAAKRANAAARRCDKGGSDTFSYHSEVRNGRCQDCQSANVVQERRYTPDIYIVPPSAEGQSDESGSREGGYYVEAKGYLRADKRALLRSLVKSGEISDLRFIIQSDYRVGKTSLSGWIDKFLKCKWALFTGEWPEIWNESRTAKKAI